MRLPCLLRYGFKGKPVSVRTRWGLDDTVRGGPARLTCAGPRATTTVPRPMVWPRAPRGERLDQKRSSPFSTPSTNAAHSAWENDSTGPSGFFESRTTIPPSCTPTSTHMPPAPLLKLERLPGDGGRVEVGQVRLRAPGNRGVDQGTGLGHVDREAKEGGTGGVGCRPTTTTRGACPSPATPRPLLPVALTGAILGHGDPFGGGCWCTRRPAPSVGDGARRTGARS